MAQVVSDLTIQGTLDIRGPVFGLPAPPPTTVLSDNVTLLGDGSLGNELAIKAVQHDSTLVQDGTVALPLGVNPNLGLNSLGIGGGTGSFNSTGVLVIGGQIGAVANGGGIGGDVLSKGTQETGYLEPTSIGPGNVNNWSPTDLVKFWSQVFVATDAAGANLTGIDGTKVLSKIITFYNLGPGVLVVKHQNGGSVGGNQFNCPGAVDLIIPPFYSFQVHRDQRPVANAKLWVRAVGQPSGTLEGVGAPDDAGIVAPVGTSYKEAGTSRVWTKYGPNAYNWEPLLMSPTDGWVYVNEDYLSSQTFSSGGSNVTGTATQSLFQGEVGAPGVMTATVTSNATPDRVRCVHMGSGGAGNLLAAILVGGGKMYGSVRTKVGALSSAVDAFSLRMLGTDSTVSADTLNGVYFENDRNAFGDNNWRAVTAAAGVRTKVDTGVPPVAGTYQTLRWTINAAGTSVDYFIDNTKVATITTNIPALGFGILHQYIKTVGVAGAITWQADYTRFSFLATR